jgi:D-amino-acid dehydrogenase
MKALVLGAGIVGVTTAYELLRDGFEVTVIDREPEAANFTSYANAGLFAPGHSYAWGSPAAPGILLKSLWRNDQALRLKPSLDPAFMKWMWAFWRECSAERAALNTSRKARLCNYSLSVFHDTLAKTGVRYDGRTGGLVYLYRTPSVFEGAVAKTEVLRDAGVRLETLGRDEIAARDPALARVSGELAGAIYAPDDESGDCRIFAQELVGWLSGAGVTFCFGESIERLEVEADHISAVVTDKARHTGDVVVLSLGIYSPHLARQLGVDLPIYPVKGYSVTVPTAGRNDVPAIGGVDEENLVAYCPLGERMRITATAEFSGYDRSHTPKDFRHMMKMARNLFPDAADYDKPEYWAGLRPMTPQGTPILGRGRHENLWYNTGQGHMGWTMCHGAARITADLIGGKKPAIPLDGMQVSG